MNEIHIGIFESLTKTAFFKNEKQEKLINSYLKRTGKKRSELTGSDVADALGEGKSGKWIAGKLDSLLGKPPKSAQKIFKQVAKEKGKKVKDLKGKDFPTFGKKY